MDNKKKDEKFTMSDYFDIAIESGALLLDASNFDWFDIPLLRHIRKEIYRTLEDETEDMDWGYATPGGKTYLKEQIALHESFIEKCEIAPDDIIVSAGGTTGAFNLVIQALVMLNGFKTGIKAIYPIPSYDGFNKGLCVYGYQTIYMKLSSENGYQMTFEKFLDVYEEDAKLLIIPNPSNPICTFIDNVELEKIVKFAMEKGMYIVYDTVFEEAIIVNNKRVQIFNMCNNYPRLIKIKGLSKDTPQLSDFRCGWTICKDETLNKLMLDIQETINYSNSTFLESLAAKEMELRVMAQEDSTDEDVVDYIQTISEFEAGIKETFRETYEFLLSNPDVVEYVGLPDAGNVMYVTLKKDACNKKGVFTSHEMFMYIFNNENILVSPGHCFGAQLDDLSFRVTISRRKERFVDGMKRVIGLFK